MFLADVATFTEQITPYLPVLGIAVGSVLVGGFAVWNRRRGATEAKAPTVAEIWAREERVTRYARRLERYAELVAASFRAYAARVRTGGSVEPTGIEQMALDEDMPSIEQPD